ncbi:hypothetical protein [Arcticibacter tournemirensis]
MESNVVSITDLEGMFALIIKKIRTENLLEIQLEMDEYWDIRGDDLGDFSKEPDLSVGSLTDDLHYLKQSLQKKEMISFSDFDRLATLLKAISNKVAPI